MTGNENPEPTRDGQEESREERLARLLAEYMDRQNIGEPLDEERITREYPDIASELLQNLKILQGPDPNGEGLPEEALGTLGDYELRRQIGRGGMGVVYEAWEKSIGRSVALKVLPAGISADPKATSRFMREAQAAGRLNHQNIVPIHAMGVYENTPYYSMDYIEGETLAEIVGKLRAIAGKEEAEKETTLEGLSQRLSRPGAATDREALGKMVERLCPAEEVEDSKSGSKGADSSTSSTRKSSFGASRREMAYYGNVARAFSEVAEGLEHAHSKGVIHRDVKPSNLILDPEGRLRILDFGLARLEGEESLTLTGDFLGTPLYMSPEQAMSKRVRVDHRTDIYSLGATLYEVLAWRPPFRGKDRQDTLSQIIVRDPAPLRRRNPRIPRDLETIVLKCLRKDPGDRYRTADALAQDLRRFATGEPIEARPQSRWEILSRRAWRNRWRLAAGLVIGLLLLTTGLLVYNHWREKYEAEVVLAKKSYEAKLELYETKVRRAATRMELGRPARRLQYQELEVEERGEAGSEDEGFDDAASEEEEEEGEGGSEGGDIGEEESEGGVRAGVPPAMPLLLDELSDPVEEAAKELREAAELVPERPDAHYHLARALLKLEKEKEARDALERALECDPRFVPALVLDSAILQQSGEEKEAQKKKEAAREIQGGDWTEAWLEAYQAEEEKSWSEAIEAYTKLIDLKSTATEPYLGFSMGIWLGRGRARLEVEDYLGALEDFAVAHAQWPELAAPALLAGKTYYTMEDPEEAEKRFQKFVASAFDRDESSLQVSRIYLDLEEYEQALTWAGKSEESPEREYLRTRCFFGLGRNHEAELAARRGLELDSTHGMLHNNLGIALERKGEREQAIVEYKKAMLDPQNSAGAHNLANLHRDQNLEEAERLCRESIARGSKFVWTYRLLGDVLSRQGRYEEALAQYRRGVEVDSENADARCELAQHLADHRRLAEAVREYRNVLDVDPEYSATYRGLNQILRSPKTAGLEAELKPLADTLEGIVSSGPNTLSSALETLALCLIQHSTSSDPDKAISCARRAVEETEGQNPDVLATLAEVQLAAGNREDAVLTLEKAVRLPEATLHHQRLLREYRKALGPLLTSYSSVDQAVDHELEVLVPEGAEWRFFPGTEEPSEGLEWTREDFDDRHWEKGRSAIGAGKYARSLRTPLGKLRGKCTTLYVRHVFEVPDPGMFERLRLLVYADSGFVAYLNGSLVGWANVNSFGIPIPYHSTASVQYHGEVPFEAILDGGKLRAGKNCLAVQGLNRDNFTAFLLLPILYAERVRDDENRQRLLKAFRAAGGEGTHRAQLAYLEGRLLQEEGRHAEAAAKFEDVLALDGTRPAPYLRLTECLGALGDFGRAEAHLRKGLRYGTEELTLLWNPWLTLSAKDLKRSPSELLASFPLPAALVDRHGSRLRWSLEQLSAQEVAEVPEDLIPSDRGAGKSDSLYAFTVDSTFPGIWKILRGAVLRKQTGDTELAGVDGGSFFREVPENGALLTGFDYSIAGSPGEGDDVIGSLQPRFLTSRGSLEGTLRGKRPPRSFTVDAKPGYAVGGLTVAADEKLRGMRLLFMKIKGNLLDPKESYESPWIGGERELAPAKLGGGGEPVVGVWGRSWDDIDAIGLVLAKSTKIDSRLLDAALAAPEELIPEGAEWRFFRGTREPSRGLEWTRLQFDDSSWERAPGGFRAGRRSTGVTLLADMLGNYTALYLRRRFTIDNPGAYRRFRLLVRAQDGFVAYLNGTELGRANAGEAGSRLPFHAGATGGSVGNVPAGLLIEPERLRPGENSIALQGLNLHGDSVAFGLEPVLEAELLPTPSGARKILEGIRTLAGEETFQARLAYLEGRVLQHEGKYREALARFRTALAVDPTQPEPHLRVAECHGAAGDPVAAEAQLRKALQSGIDDRELWEAWFRVSAVELKRSCPEMLSWIAAFPARNADDADAGSDLRWLLTELKEQGIVRINCGGGEYRSATGTVWGKDRFYRAGYLHFGDGYGNASAPFAGEIAGTDDDPLYQTERWFPPDRPDLSYRIPLPPGLYRVGLHFSEIFLWKKRGRLFSVALEGERVLKDYEPLAAGFATAEKKVFPVQVQDGFLDIEFYRRAEFPKISAIEIERILRGSSAMRLALPKSATRDYQILDAALAASALLIPDCAKWRFYRGWREPSPGLEWTQLGFDDDAWEEGVSSFGAGGNKGMATYLADMMGQYDTLYLRHRFSVSDPTAFRNLRFSIHFDDGFVAYLNEEEVGRTNAGSRGERIPVGEGAPVGSGANFAAMWLDVKNLHPGENCLAIQALNRKGDRRGCFFEPILEADRFLNPVQDRKLLDTFRVSGGTEKIRARLAYLEGRTLQAEGKHREAAAKFENVLSLDRSEPEPFLRLGESLRALGHATRAEERLLEAFQHGGEALEELQNLWYAVSAGDLKRSPEELLASFPFDPGDLGRRGEMLRWSLERLREREIPAIPDHLSWPGSGPTGFDPLYAFALETSFPGMWKILGAAVSGELTEKTQLVGSQGRLAPEEIPVEGALLTGFRVTVSNPGNPDFIKSLQPLFLTSKGNRDGALRGYREPPVLTTAAKPGYAVGGLLAAGDTRLRRMKVLFMRIRGNRLDSEDAYESPWIGSQKKLETVKLGGEGEPVVGIWGSSGNDDIDSLGLVLAKSTPLDYDLIDTVLEAPEVLIPEGAEWRFFRGTQDPSAGLEWTGVDFDDRRWERGPSGFGYGDGDDATVLDDMRGMYTSLYVRHVFEINDRRSFDRLLLTLVADDGYVAYLNGNEVGRSLVGPAGARVPFDGVARSVQEPLTAIHTPVDPGLLRPGKNVLAIQGLNSTLDSSDFSLIPVLMGERTPDLDRDRERSEALLTLLENDEHASKVGAYVKGRILQREAKHSEAAQMFEELLSLDKSQPEPFLRLGESLRALGDATRAEKQLLEAIRHGCEDLEGVWDLWYAVSAGELKRSPEELLATFSSEAGNLGRRGEVLRWSLERLRERGFERIPARLLPKDGSPWDVTPLYAFAVDPGIWKNLGQKMEWSLTHKTALAGGSDGLPFENVVREGALLTGLELSWDNRSFIRSVDPLFLTSRGGLGPTDDGGGSPNSLTLRARPGYAVGALVVTEKEALVGARDGRVVTALKVRFMRVGANGLDPGDSYDSQWIPPEGSPVAGEEELILGGDGSPVIGVYGSVGGASFAIGLLTSLPAPSYSWVDRVLWFPLILIPEGAEWRFFRGNQEPSPGLEWTRVDFDDGRWDRGPSGFGYGDGDDATVLDDMRGMYTSLYIRHVFEINDPRGFDRLLVSVKADDGYIAYLNGKEVGRCRAGPIGVRMPFDGVAVRDAQELPAIQTPVDAGLLRPGKNVLALQGLNSTLDSSDFSLIPLLRGEETPDLKRDREGFEGLLRLLENSEHGSKVAAYLDGRLLERVGRYGEALEKFQKIVDVETAESEPVLRLAECLRAQGESARAEKRLREALHGDGRARDSRALWEFWFALCAVDLKRSAAEVLALMPEAAGGRKGAGSPEGDLRWLIEQLVRDGAVRINCGGEEYWTSDGVIWGRDRFMVSGQDRPRRNRPVDATENDPLYQTYRCFFADTSPPHSYRVPLPPGRYRVSLHFAEMWVRQAGKLRSFDVLLAGEKVLENYEPKRLRAEVLSFERAIEGGHLDLEFIHKVDNPKICAIEIVLLR